MWLLAIHQPHAPRRGITAQRSVELLQAARQSFVLADSQLTVARQKLDEISIDEISEQQLLDVEELSDFQETIKTYNDLALLSPALLTQLLGLDEVQTYLVLAQNNDELRPSGGYISTWGYIRVEDGDIDDYQYFPTTIETPDPPTI